MNTLVRSLLLFVLQMPVYQLLAQPINVSLEQNNVIKVDKTNVQAPVNLKFDKKDFEGKSLSFYSPLQNEASKLTTTKFGPGGLSHISSDQGDFYEIRFAANASFSIKDELFRLKENKLRIRMGNGKFSPLITIKDGPDGANADNQVLGSSGFIVPDAILLTELYAKASTNSEAATEALKLLSLYGVTDGTNLFLPYESLVKIAGHPFKDDGQDTGGAQKGILSSIGGLDVTTVADGFARFIVKRTKEELSINFFSVFKKELEKYKDLQAVFPNTYRVLQSIDEDIYNYNHYVNTLREAFRSDILIIDENLPAIIENHPEFFDKEGHFIYAAALRSGCYVSSSIRHNMHAGDILEGYPLTFLDGAKGGEAKTIANLKGSIQLLQLLSESMKAQQKNNDDPYWVGIDQLRKIANDPIALKLYIGLTLQLAIRKYDGVPFGNTSVYMAVNQKPNVDAFNTNYPIFKQYILTFGSRLAELNKMLKEATDKSSNLPDSVRVERYAIYFKNTTQFLAFSIEATQLPYIKTIPGLESIGHNTKIYFDVAYKTTDLVTSINRKRYAESINHLVSIYELVVKSPITSNSSNPTPNLSKKEKIQLADDVIAKSLEIPKEPVAAVVKENPAVKNVKSIQGNSEVKSVNETFIKLVKYGSFMAEVVNAKSSKEVSEAIEAAALPAGSSRIKRSAAFNVSLNAYCGLFYGKEVITEIEDNNLKDWNSYGLTAPIGVAVSIGKGGFLPFAKRETYKNNWSHSLFVSVIDLGAVTAYRFQNDKTEEVPTIQFEDIFSPGAFWSLGIPNSPLSLNLGAQVGPNLRKVHDVTNDYSNSTYVRYSVALCVDIPLLNVYTRTERKKKQ